VAGVAAGLQGIVEIAHDLGGLEIDGVLILEFVLLVAGDERKGVNVLVKRGERKFDSVNAAASEERQTFLLFGFEVQGTAYLVFPDQNDHDSQSFVL